jgi:hypothetical protein
MTDPTWTWAQLDELQLRVLHEAEKTLGADYVLAYRAGGEADVPIEFMGLRTAALSDSQLECLRGVETQLNATLVAYHKQA